MSGTLHETRNKIDREKHQQKYNEHDFYFGRLSWICCVTVLDISKLYRLFVCAQTVWINTLNLWTPYMCQMQPNWIFNFDFANGVMKFVLVFFTLIRININKYTSISNSFFSWIKSCSFQNHRKITAANLNFNWKWNTFSQCVLLILIHKIFVFVTLF